MESSRRVGCTVSPIATPRIERTSVTVTRKVSADSHWPVKLQGAGGREVS